MRISDWSSDVCSSDLQRDWPIPLVHPIQKPKAHGCPAWSARRRRHQGGPLPCVPRPSANRTFHVWAAWTPQCHAPQSAANRRDQRRSEEHTSELQSLMRISYAVFCLKKKTDNIKTTSRRTKHNVEYPNTR